VTLNCQWRQLCLYLFALLIVNVYRTDVSEKLQEQTPVNFHALAPAPKWETGIVEVSALQVSALQVSVLQVSASQVSALQVSASQVSISQVSISQVSVLQVSALQVSRLAAFFVFNPSFVLF